MRHNKKRKAQMASWRRRTAAVPVEIPDIVSTTTTTTTTYRSAYNHGGTPVFTTETHKNVKETDSNNLKIAMHMRNALHNLKEDIGKDVKTLGSWIQREYGKFKKETGLIITEGMHKVAMGILQAESCIGSMVTAFKNEIEMWWKTDPVKDLMVEGDGDE